MPTAKAALNQRLLFFKIPYLEIKRGACRSRKVNKYEAIARPPKPPFKAAPDHFVYCI
jgi:hypothetical protein